MGDEVYAVIREPPGVERGAFVVCGSAGRGLSLSRSSNGRPNSDDAAISPTLDGVGVNGGDLIGDSPAGFRRLGKGVAGSSGTAKVGST